MTCDFTSFSTVFQSYQDDGQMIMKGCVQWSPVYRLKTGKNRLLMFSCNLILSELLLSLVCSVGVIFWMDG